MSSQILNSCWNALCNLANMVKEFENQVDFCSMGIGAKEWVEVNKQVDSPSDGYTVNFVLNPEISVLDLPPSGKGACFQLRGLIQLVELQSDGLPEEVLQFIKVYAPYCFAAMHAKRWKRTFVVSHFAQSLDGRIATYSGESKWIGSLENQVHAHRMRALCDGVLIGSRTLRQDQSKLTVRHVSGDNPIRIVLGNCGDAIHSLTKSSPDPILLIGADVHPQDDRIRTVKLERKDGFIPSFQILKTLYQQKIYSVYIEGGATTTSRFLKEKAIDIMQLHNSPMIIGSGLNSFEVPPIQNIGDSVRFESYMYLPVGDGIMFVGSIPDTRSIG